MAGPSTALSRVPQSSLPQGSLRQQRPAVGQVETQPYHAHRVPAPEGPAYRPAQPISVRAGGAGRADLAESRVLKPVVEGPQLGF